MINYSHNMRILKLPSSTAVNSLIYRLKASANSLDIQLNFVVANGTDPNLIMIKSVDFYQANVYLVKVLSRDVYNFTIYVTDGSERTNIHCQIQVYNTTQYMSSSFIHFKPLLSISESAKFNSTVGYIHVKEPENSNLPVTFEITGSENFGIKYIFGPKGTSKAKIYLKTILDYEKQNLFRIQVFALNAWTNETVDTRNIIMKEVVVTVINEQDTPPQFIQLPHLVQLSEHTREDDIVLSLYAIDGDHEQDNEMHQCFNVDPNNGEVVLKCSIDDLKNFIGVENLFTLTFIAKELDQILLNNDRFSSNFGNEEANFAETNLISNFNLNNTLHNHNLIAEESGLDNNFEDADDLETNLENHPVFNNELLNTNLLNLKTNKQVLKDFYESQVNVAFIILQLDNHAPQFLIENSIGFKHLNHSLFGNISEDSKLYSTVSFNLGSLKIEDKDYGLNGTFDIFLEDKIDVFDIQPKYAYRNSSIFIQLINTSKIDFEHLSINPIQLKLIAVDRSPFKPLKSELQLFVNVIDVNDNSPQFSQNKYIVQIKEDQHVPSKLTSFSASDKDSGFLGNVTYYALHGPIVKNFQLDKNTGLLTLISLKNIDRELQDIYNLIIEICDNNCDLHNSNHNFSILEVQILDSNDNRPQFNAKRYDFVLNSDYADFTSPAQVTAKDADQENSLNSAITYEIIAGNLENKFKIDPITGLIELIEPLQLDRTDSLVNLPLINIAKIDSSDENAINLDALNERLPWTGENFDIVHLDNLFNYFSPIINLTIRAHDQGFPILDNYVNVYIHSQNYLNRTVIFLLNEQEHIVRRKRSEFERNLSELVGGRVKIKLIREPQIGQYLPNKTLIYSSVTYPVQSSINVAKVGWVANKLTHSKHHWSTNDSENDLSAFQKPSSFDSNKRQSRNQMMLDVHSVKTSGWNDGFIVWLLIIIILITLIFLIILIGIWCYFCSCKPSKRKNKIGSADSNHYYQHKKLMSAKPNFESNLIDSNQNHLIDSSDNGIDKNIFNENSNNFTLKKQQLKLSKSYDGVNHSLASPYDMYQMSEFDARAYSNRIKNRPYSQPTNPNISRISLENNDQVCLKEFNTNRKPVFNQKNVGHNFQLASDHLQEMPNTDVVEYLDYFGEAQLNQSSNQSNINFENETKQNAVLIDLIAAKYNTIRSNKVKFRDDENSLNEETKDDMSASSSDDRLQIEKNNYFKVTSEKKQQDQDSFSSSKQRSLSQLTLNSQFDTTTNLVINEGTGETVLNNKQARVSILKNGNESNSTSNCLVKDKLMTDENQIMMQLSEGEDKDQVKKFQSECEKSFQNFVPTPPPLPTNLSSSINSLHLVKQQKLQLKNEDIANKKSIFTIAYNGMKTNRLNSADSNNS